MCGSFVSMVSRCGNGSRKDAAMLTEERVRTRPIPPIRLKEVRSSPEREERRPEFSVAILLGRVLVVAIGFGLAFTGWMLMMSVFLVFIGLPLFFFGLAVMQTQER
jgi:hypothetical protein